MSTSAAAQDCTEAHRSLQDEDGKLGIDDAKDVATLIERLHSQARDLSPTASNANHVLSSELLSFLASSSGKEFGEAMRLASYERFEEATERHRRLRNELADAQAQLYSTNRVFAFVEALTGQVIHGMA